MNFNLNRGHAKQRRTHNDCQQAQVVSEFQLQSYIMITTSNMSLLEASVICGVIISIVQQILPLSADWFPYMEILFVQKQYKFS